MDAAMQGFGARQASIDYHLEMARRCLALSVSTQRSLLSDGPDPLLQCHDSEEVVDNAEQPQHGSRIAAKIIHLRNLIATLTPIPATTEVDQYSVFDRFRANVETLWSDKCEHGARERRDTQPRFVRHAHADLSMSRRSLEISPTSTPRHRRAGSSRI